MVDGSPYKKKVRTNRTKGAVAVIRPPAADVAGVAVVGVTRPRQTPGACATQGATGRDTFASGRKRKKRIRTGTKKTKAETKCSLSRRIDADQVAHERPQAARLQGLDRRGAFVNPDDADTLLWCPRPRLDEDSTDTAGAALLDFCFAALGEDLGIGGRRCQLGTCQADATPPLGETFFVDHVDDTAGQEY
jgi:hypothetical protein